MKTITGDLLDLALYDGQFDVVVHGCNCFCNFGAGIAFQICRRFPEAYAADLRTVSGDKSKLGTYTKAKIIRGSLSFDVVNAYTQYGCGADEVRCDYGALHEVFKSIAVDYAGQKIGYPMIGAGLAGGDWDIISEIINRDLEGLDHTLVVLP